MLRCHLCFGPIPPLQPLRRRHRPTVPHFSASPTPPRRDHRRPTDEDLSQVLLIRGVPKHVRRDNGPEFIAAKIRRYLAKAKIGTLYIEPGAPWENGYEESFFSRLRDEFLNAELFADLREAKTLAAQYQNHYNHRRPHSSLGYWTPAEFAARCIEGTFSGALPLNPRLLPLRKVPGEQEAETVSNGQTLITAGT